MEKLTDELLIEAYFASLKYKLDSKFIFLLLLEIVKRNIILPKRQTL